MTERPADAAADGDVDDDVLALDDWGPATDQCLRLVAYETALATTVRDLPPSLVDFLS